MRLKKAIPLLTLGPLFGILLSSSGVSARGPERSGRAPLAGKETVVVRLELEGQAPQTLFEGVPGAGAGSQTLLKKATYRLELGGASQSWDAFSLGEWIDQLLGQISVETRSEVDLVFFEEAQGRRVALPRAFLRKYPEIALGVRQSDLKSLPVGVALAQWTPLFPWGRDKFVKEGLSSGLYSGLSVRTIILGNSKSKFSGWVLKRRTDPLAVRGEGVYLQTCVTCHSTEGSPRIADTGNAWVGKHSRLFSPKQGLNLEDRDYRSLVRYLDALNLEKRQSGAESASPTETQQSSSHPSGGSSSVLPSDQQARST